jgi:hypothetical protein
MGFTHFLALNNIFKTFYFSHKKLFILINFTHFPINLKKFLLKKIFSKEMLNKKYT